MSKEMHNDDNLNLHLHEQISGWLRYRREVQLLTKVTYCRCVKEEFTKFSLIMDEIFHAHILNSFLRNSWHYSNKGTRMIRNSMRQIKAAIPQWQEKLYSKGW